MITDKQRKAIRKRLRTLTLVHEVGYATGGTACTISAINLALTGQLTDTDPSKCMWDALRLFVIRVQDEMPLQMMEPGDEHGDLWRAIVPYIAGSRDLPDKPARLALILDWMWERLGDPAVVAAVPAHILPVWQSMVTLRTLRAADDASKAAVIAARTAPDVGIGNRNSADAAPFHAAIAVGAALDVNADNAAMEEAAFAARAAATLAPEPVDYWRRADPAKLLEAVLLSCSPASWRS